MSKYYLGRVVVNGFSWTGEPLSEITPDQKEEIQSSISFVPYFYTCRQIRNITIESGTDFITYYNSLAKTQRIFNEREMIELLTSANKLLISYLSFLKSFFDITSKQLAIKKPGLLKDFQRKNSTMYDSFLGYRFLSRLRNYVIHVAMPLVQVSSYSTGVSFSCSKNELLKYDGWSTIRSEISQLPESFSVVPFVSESNHVIDQLYLFALTAILDDVSEGSLNLRKALESYNETMFAIGEEKDRMVVWSKLPLHLIKEYLDEISRSEYIAILHERGTQLG